MALAGAYSRTVTICFWLGLVHCYALHGPPHTNNDLEHVFGSARYRERRTR